MAIANRVNTKSVAQTLAVGAQSATTMAPESSVFDVWTHSFDGAADSMAGFINDPVGTYTNRAAESFRMAREMVDVGDYDSASRDQIDASMAAQWDAMGDQIAQLFSGTITEADGTERPRTALEAVGQTTNQTFQLLTSAEQYLSSIVSIIPFPAFPAIRVGDMDIGWPHGHMHPPNFMPPVIPTAIPLPSTGPIIPIPIFSGATRTLINGMPAARCQDMGLGIWCGGYFPMYEVLLGSSNVWIEGMRAGRVLCDLTKHCIFSTPKPSDFPVYTFLGTTISSSTNVVIGGVPLPSLMAIAMGRAFRGLGRAVGTASRAFEKATRGLRKKMFSWMDDGFLKCRVLKGEPVNAVTGEVVLEQQDFEVPGLIPISWTRAYRSSGERVGVCGKGWETIADARIEIDADGQVLFTDGASGRTIFEQLPVVGQTASDGVVGYKLYRGKEAIRVRSTDKRVWWFPTSAPVLRETGTMEYVVATIEDGYKNTLRFVRDKNGLREIVESSGRRITVRSDKGLIREIAMKAADGRAPQRLVRYEYDSHGHLLAARDAHEEIDRYTYQACTLAQITDRKGLSFYYEYDQPGNQGRCVHSWGEDGLYDYRFRYDPVNHQTTIIDSLGRASKFVYTSEGYVTEDIDPDGKITRYTYDEVGRTLSQTDPVGRRTEWAYDADGNEILEKRADGSSIVREYDSQNNPVSITDPNGETWRYRWNDQGALIEEQTPLGAVTRYAYDARGQPAQIINPEGDTTRLAFDHAGNLERLTDALGNTTVFSHDEFSNVLSRTDPLGHRTRYAYDKKQRLVQIRQPNGGAVRLGYDVEDNISRIQDENGAVTRFEYGGLDVLKRRIQPDGHVVEYHYDTEEQFTGVTNQRGERYTLERDGAGRVTAEIDYWGQRRDYQYDEGGAIRSIIDPLRRRIDFETDPLGRILRKIVDPDENPFIETFEYDNNGNLIAAANPDTRITRQFDADGRLTAETQGDEFRIDNQYDRLGNRTERKTQYSQDSLITGHIVRYEYDANGLAAKIHIDDHDPIVFERDAMGQLIGEQLSRELTRSTAYDSMGNLQQTRMSDAKQVLFEVGYEYDLAGNQISKTDSKFGQDRYRYDLLGQITEHIDPLGKVQAYLRDPTGDSFVTRIVDRATRRETSTSAAQSTDEGDSLDWYREAETAAGRVVFDRAGNMVSRGDGPDLLKLYWATDGRLMASEKGGRRTEYQYDPLGRRTAKWTGNNGKRFFWDGDIFASEFDKKTGVCESTSALQREWICSPKSFEPVALLSSERSELDYQKPNLYLYHNEPNGCPSLVVNSVGDTVWLGELDSLGKVDVTTSIVENPFRLLGQYWDLETELAYNRFRYFDSQLGTFLSADPIGLAPGENTYWIAPNVFSWTDELGLTHSPQKTATKPLALGIDRYLDNFARKHSATTWKQFEDIANWKPQVLDAILNPNQRVLFNLDGVEVWPGVTRSATGRGGATDWELLQIRQNPQAWDSIEFFKDGKKWPNPFQ